VSAICFASLELTQLDCRFAASKNFVPQPAFLQRLSHSPLVSVRILRSSIGFLDTFDPFDSSGAALPQNFL